MFWCLLTALGQTHHRLVRRYEQYPYCLAQLIDTTIPVAERSALADRFLNKNLCCVDCYYSVPLRATVSSATDLLPPSAASDKLEVTFRQKQVNIEIETNFARAASQRSTMRGRAHTEISALSKHVSAEIKLGHKRSILARTARADAEQNQTGTEVPKHFSS
jgi:hypothetical protein